MQTSLQTGVKLTKNVKNLTSAIPKSSYKITLGFIDFQHFFRG